ncbi:uncharacterized protein LOC117920963 [Vitis riparia]|uniref:uncharacterized protein LOC117920963 n=1 Tax=Vitis riparia TaxID=96939 RepID=UPI00155AC806|nr:uncharacterized protein LOC117920963 [Vitis riparia]
MPQNSVHGSSTGRAVGGTENSWCRAVPGGTGVVTVALLLSKPPEASVLQSALHTLQNRHALLGSKLHYGTTTNTFSFITSPIPPLQVKSFNLSSTCQLLQSLVSSPNTHSVSPFHLILEHELNQNPWCNLKSPSYDDGTDVFFASIYTLPDAKWVVVLRLHTAVCDRTTAVSLLRELIGVVREKEGGGREEKMRNDGEVSLGIEDFIPSGKAKKALWVRGVDMLSYSVNSLQLTNLKFKDVKSPRSSEVVRLQLNQDDTESLLAVCSAKGIKLCGALVAAALIAGHSSKRPADHHKEKYAVVTLTDCRPILDPPLSTHHFGFYHSAILNTLSMKGGEKLWELARRSYMAFANSKNCNKHFSDMADLNFLMRKAIENPGLTSASSLRTSFLTVFEDPVIETNDEIYREIVGLEDYIGCASVHGIGPSIAIFDTIRGGMLDCACVYPSPLHSREQMEELLHNMKRLLVDAAAHNRVPNE